ncbi:hypothetical protein H9Y04_43545 [Streptomyces sp. TRM66268-LWL]|uniref:Uncharacterized protein n=1 Tax=Streptomyces polyasparticus TaxID=2767826 RepID=A0ABR7SV76_9ACTN|nr:hypothetical protein [Streptomyces polyasparticus]MBC9719407.1 hypothetical protein [Streptomyces polyasparticus]
MSEWVSVLAGAGGAVAASAVTGWFTRGSAMRQADAQVESTHAAIKAEARLCSLESRRHIYAELLAAVESALLTERTGRGQTEDPALLHKTLGALILEGPAD